MKCKWYLIVFMVAITAGCRKESYEQPDLLTMPASAYSGQHVRDYFEVACSVARTTPGFFPPQVARAYGYIGLTAYEAVLYGIPNAQSVAAQLNKWPANSAVVPLGATEYNWAISSNAAMAYIIKKMFGDATTARNRLKIDSIETANLQSLATGLPIAVVERSVTFGQKVAESIYAYSLTDGGDRSYTDPFQLPFTMPADPFCWVPTGAVIHAVSPYWGNNRPFMAECITKTQQHSPVPFSTKPTSLFYKQALQVKQQVSNNTADQVTIAKYWADDPFNTCTPTGHTFNIMSQLLKENNATLEKTSVAYAQLALAENDAFIACWKQKYTYNLVRPVTYIKNFIDPGFTTVIGTPPFPAFTSGHSAEIGAGCQVFIHQFTDGSGAYPFTDFSQLLYGFIPRNFTNFNDLAKECADSRLYGGIHYPMDNEDGLAQGRDVGNFIINNIRWPKNIR